MTGTAIAQAISFALSPVISRLFTPADFGVFGSFGAITGTIAAIVTLDYSQAIVLPKQRDDAGQILLLSCLTTVTITLVCSAVCLLWPAGVLEFLTSRNGVSLVLLAMAVLIAGLTTSLQAWCIRAKAFGKTSASQVVRSLSSNSLQLGLGSLSAGALGLVVSSVLADLLASVSLFSVVRPDLRRILNQASWSRLKDLALEYRDFPIYSATMNGLGALSMGLPVLLLARYYGIETAGAYAFGVRVLQTPMSLVTGAVRQVLLQRASETHNSGGRLLPLFLRVTAGLFGLALVPSLLLFAWSPAMFVWLFGPQWHVAGTYARWLVVWLLFMFCNAPTVLFSRIMRIQRAAFVLNLLLLSSRAMALVLGGQYLPAEQTILAFSLVGALINVIGIVFVGGVLISREGLWGNRNRAPLSV